VADILRSGHENDRCRDRRDDRRVVTRDPRNWPDSRDRDWPDTRSNWPVPTYPRYATQANTTAQVIAQRALEILRAAP
jgi:hypothetical protein